MDRRQVGEQREEQLAVELAHVVVRAAVAGTGFLRQQAGKEQRGLAACQRIGLELAFLGAVLGAYRGLHRARRHLEQVAIEPRTELRTAEGVVGVRVRRNVVQRGDLRRVLQVEDVDRRAARDDRAGRAAMRAIGVDERRPECLGQLVLQQVTVDFDALAHAAHAGVHVPLPRVAERAAQTAVRKHLVGGDFAAAVAQRLEAHQHVRVVARAAAERSPERVVDAVGRDDRVVGHGVERQRRDRKAGSRLVVDDLAVRLHRVVDVVVQVREQAAALLRRHQQIERLVVVEVAGDVEAAEVGERRAGRASGARQERVVAAELRLRRGIDSDEAGRSAGRTTRGHDAAVEVQRVGREGAVAGRDLLLLVVVRAEHDADAVSLVADREAHRAAIAVALAGLSIQRGDLRAVEVAPRDEIDDTGDRVRSVDRAGPLLQDLDALDHVDRQHVDVDRRSLGIAVNADAPAIDQHQRALCPEATQFDVRLTGATAVVDGGVGRGARDCRQPLQHVAHGR